MAERLATLEKAFRQHPELPLFARLAERYLQRGLLQRAAELCRGGCARFPEYAPGHAVLGRCLEALDDPAAAREALRRALELDPHSPAALKRLAALQQRLGDERSVRELLAQASSLDPFDEEARSRLDELTYTARLEEVGARVVPYDELPREQEIQAAMRDRAGAGDAAPEREVADEPAAGAAAAPAPAAEFPDLAPAGAAVGGVEPEAAQSADGFRAPCQAGVAPVAAAPLAREPGRPAASADEQPLPLHDEQVAHVLTEIQGAPAQPAGTATGAPGSDGSVEPGAPPAAVAGFIPALATATLAAICERQGLTEHAARVYEFLLTKDPANEQWQAKLAALRAQGPATDGPPSEKRC